MPTKKPTRSPATAIRQNIVPLFAALAALQFLLLVLGYISLRNTQDSYQKQLDVMQSNVQAASAAAGLTRAVVSVTDDAVYIPELRLKLPLNALTTQFTYSVRTGYVGSPVGSSDAAEANISTTTLATYPLPPQPIGCSTSVRLKFEAKPNPYNPHETVRASVQLGDGRTLQAYSYQHDTCDKAFSLTGTDSKRQAEVFQQAKSY
ncbi:MAG TPA: hypothetical protein VF572_00555 [Candidatus Saccharimonadales bacterium]|jgi:hypothetical protein